jgi:hypothetical protein
MPIYKVNKVSLTYCHKGLALFVASLGELAVMLCSDCTTIGSLYVFSLLQYLSG